MPASRLHGQRLVQNVTFTEDALRFAMVYGFNVIAVGVQYEGAIRLQSG